MKRFISILLSLCIFSTTLIVPIPVEAASSVVERAISWAIAIANDNSHGYSQSSRWGPDYDCSSFVISAFRSAGVNTGTATYTGNMKNQFTQHGFQWIPWSQIGSVSNLQRGDILLNEVSHTEIYLGNGQNVGAHSNRGYPQTGDQTGTEVSVSGYYNHPWDGVLRYVATDMKPSYSNVSTYKSVYGLHEKIGFNIQASNVYRMTIGVDTVGVGRAFTESCDFTGNYEMGAWNLGFGSYSTYFTLWNGNQYIDTGRVLFSVEPPSYTHFNVSKKMYALHENINFSINAAQTEYMVIGIDKEGEGRVHTETFDPTNNFGISANKLGAGDYTAYISLYSTNDYFVDTEKVHFSVREPSYSRFNVSKSKYGLHEDINFSINAAQTEYMIVGIDKEGEGRVHTEMFNPTNSYGISANKLGAGDYTAYISLYSTNDCFVDTEKVCFSVKEPSYTEMSISKPRYELHEQISFHLNVAQTEFLIIGIDQIGKGRVFTQRCDSLSEFEIAAEKLGLGEYTAYFTLYSHGFDYYTDTTKVKFTVEEKIVEHVHEKTVIPGIQATCTQSGKTMGWKCSSCGDIIEKQQIIPALGHRNTELKNVKKATCAQEGYSGDTYCLDCGTKISSGKIIPAVEHSMGVWIITKNATCTSAGTQTRTCVDCGRTESQTIKAIGHNYKSQVVSPTCTEKGYTIHTCEKCGENYKDSFVNETGHNYTGKITTSATCTSDGIITYTCKTCNEKKTSIIPSTGHSYETSIIAPTYEKEGYMLHKCKNCGCSYKDTYVELIEKPTNITVKPTISHVETTDKALENQKSVISQSTNNVKHDNSEVLNIKVKVTKIKSLKKSYKSLKVKWKRVKKVSGYQIQYSTSRKFKKAKKVTIKNPKTTSKTIKKLKSKKKYYIRIRTYIIVNGKKKYSDWSKKKSQKTK